MKQDRFLTGILIGIGVLVVTALVVFFARKSEPAYVAEDSPQGVVHNYVVALLNKDYARAYNYLADLEHKPSYDQFRRRFLQEYVAPQSASVDVGVTTYNSGDEASVEIVEIYNNSDLFSPIYRNVYQALLIRQNDNWKISYFPLYNFWDFSWYQEPPK
jgi:hypothetical protein